MQWVQHADYRRDLLVNIHPKQPGDLEAKSGDENSDLHFPHEQADRLHPHGNHHPYVRLDDGYPPAFDNGNGASLLALPGGDVVFAPSHNLTEAEDL